MLEPSISVIIPVYNEEKTIASIVEIIRTWNKAKEIIIVNDGSTDKTIECLHQFKNSITLISRKKNRGKGFSMAEGIRRSSGDILLFFDGDVLGVTHKDLDAIVDPLKNRLFDMVIAVTNVSKIGNVRPFDAINGERALLRKNVMHHLEKFTHVGSGVEFVMNDIHKNKRVKMLSLKHVYLLSKFEKVEPTEAVLQYIKEAKHFLTAILQIQANGITPQARKLLNVSQRYLRRALDYFS